jgi:hypothetical protein
MIAHQKVNVLLQGEALKTRAESIKTAISEGRKNKNKSREGEINAKMTGEVLLRNSMGVGREGFGGTNLTTLSK